MFQRHSRPYVHNIILPSIDQKLNQEQRSASRSWKPVDQVATQKLVLWYIHTTTWCCLDSGYWKIVISKLSDKSWLVSIVFLVHTIEFLTRHMIYHCSTRASLHTDQCIDKDLDLGLEGGDVGEGGPAVTAAQISEWSGNGCGNEPDISSLKKREKSPRHRKATILLHEKEVRVASFDEVLNKKKRARACFFSGKIVAFFSPCC